jgi:hypothetical protein
MCVHFYLNKPVGGKKTPLLLSHNRNDEKRKKEKKSLLFELNIDDIFEKVN